MEHKNLWAPWRMEYIKGLAEEEGCFICRYIDDTQNDRENLLLWRTPLSVVIFNRFPYNNGHMLIAPKRHIPDFESANEQEMLEQIKLIRECQKVLTKTIAPHGFNIGMNFGRCAGAGLPEHMHIHIVPRWDGDTNYMAVCGQTDVISQGMTDLYDQLKEISQKNNLPDL